MTDTTATPRPWRLAPMCDDGRDAGLAFIERARDESDGPGELITSIGHYPDARLIVRAVNAHDALFQALSALLGWHESDPTSLGALQAANHARQVLAKASGERP